MPASVKHGDESSERFIVQPIVEVKTVKTCLTKIYAEVSENGNFKHRTLLKSRIVKKSFIITFGLVCGVSVSLNKTGITFSE